VGGLYAEDNVDVSPSHHILTREVIASGEFELSGSCSTALCGIYAESIRVSGGNSRFTACPDRAG
jgi:hypothetical protein